MQNPHRAGVPFVVAAWALVVALLSSSAAHAWGIVIELNRPPTIAGVPGESVTSGQPYDFAPNASDPDGDPLTFSIANQPAWASFSTSTGQLSGTPGATHVGTYAAITITVSDGKASATLGPFAITVIAANRPPVIGGTPAGAVIAGFAYSFTPSASDPEGQPLTFTIANRPAWASFSASTGRLSGTPGATHVGTYADITITVSDGQESATLGPFSITVAANRAPVITGTPPGSVTAGSAYAFTPGASDPDGQRLSFSIANRPAWASFSTSTGRLSGTPGATHVGTYSNVAITVSDGRASATLGPFSITVAANRPPVIGGTPQGSVIVGDAYSFTPTASDPDGQRLTFSIANRPAWASFSTSTGRLSGTPGATHVGTYSNVAITASDGRASATLGPFSIVVEAVPRTATVSWTPPTTFEDGTPLTNLAGFRIFYGQSLLAFTRSVTIPSPDITSAVIEELGSGTWYFAVKAYTTSNVESNFSAIRQKTFP